MRNRTRIRAIGRMVSGVNPDIGRRTIVTITSDGSGHALVTTKSPHGLTSSDGIVISGSSVVDYNASWSIGNITTRTFILVGNGTYTSDATGGRWDHNA